MEKLDVLNEFKEALLFEGAWLYESSNASDEEKEEMLEGFKIIWNRSIGRLGTRISEGLCISENDFKDFAERVWGGDDE